MVAILSRSPEAAASEPEAIAATALRAYCARLGRPPDRSTVFTPADMRLFALECLRWSEQTGNARQRDLMIRMAKTWMNTASTFERRANGGDALAMADLPAKRD